MAKKSMKIKASREPKFEVRRYTRCNRCRKTSGKRSSVPSRSRPGRAVRKCSRYKIDRNSADCTGCQSGRSAMSSACRRHSDPCPR